MIHSCSTTPSPPTSTLFPYTTLFRSPASRKRSGPMIMGFEWSGANVDDYHEVRRSEEHTSELQSRENLVCRLLLEKKNCGASVVVRPVAQRPSSARLVWEFFCQVVIW